MSTPEFEEKLFLRYLGLLGIRRHKPGIHALTEIVRSQVIRVPFENVSKLYYKKRHGLDHLVGFEQYLDGIEQFRFGGTCYANNFYLNRLLAWLGYEVKLCGADMKTPDVHIVNIVNVESREFLVDAGYAAPFLGPLPRDLSNDYTVALGSDRYVLKPRDSNNRSRLELYRNGELRHGYVVNPLARHIEEFQQVIAKSLNDSATFMNALLLVRFGPQSSFVIHNMTVIESAGDVTTRYSVDTRDQVVSLVEKHFAIPSPIVQEVLAELPMLGDAWG